MNTDDRMKELMGEPDPTPEEFKRYLKYDKAQIEEERKRLRDSWKNKKQYPR